MSDWDEIKRLAADFQRTQTSDTLQRISERNCIDIVKKLTDLNLIELIYTCDGKQFITPSHLTKEIEDEVYASGGRMHIHDLAANLNVDYQHIENKAKDLVKEKPDEYSLILGQIIHSTYKRTLSKQINDWMLNKGQLSIADFAKSLDLPSEFLLTIVSELLPMVIDDYVTSQDGRTFYTSDMMDRYRSIIAGTLTAISRPVPLTSLIKRLDIPDRIFSPILDSLIKDGRLEATIENRLYIPSIYAREQTEWIHNFYSSNSFIEYEVLSRMDIKQPKTFLKKKYPDGIQLKSCFISPDLKSQVESVIEDSIASNSWIDVSTILPVAIEPDNIEQLLQDIFKSNKTFSSTGVIFDKVYVCSHNHIAKCRERLSQSMSSKAKQDLDQGKLEEHFMDDKTKELLKKNKQSAESPESCDKETEKEVKDEEEKDQPSHLSDEEVHDKKTKVELSESNDLDEGQTSKKSKRQKGSQGREVKQRATKKKYFAGNKNQSDDETTVAPSKTPRSNKGRAARRAVEPEIENQRPRTQQKEPLVFMVTDDIVNKLKLEHGSNDDCSEEFLESIAKAIETQLNESYIQVAKQTFKEFIDAQKEADTTIKNKS